MKNILKRIIILLIVVLFPALESCKKYSDGPLISFRSKAERVANIWKVENYKINGNDYTSLVASYVESYSKGGNFSYNWGILSGSGVWTFQNNSEQIKLTGSDGQSSRNLYIQKLEEKSFWYYYMDGNDKHELHLIPM